MLWTLIDGGADADADADALSIEGSMTVEEAHAN
jgi:hypothetical protein